MAVQGLGKTHSYTGIKITVVWDNAVSISDNVSFLVSIPQIDAGHPPAPPVKLKYNRTQPVSSRAGQLLH